MGMKPPLSHGLDLSHPITKNLMFAVAFQGAYGESSADGVLVPSARELVTGHVPITANSSSSDPMSITASRYGLAYRQQTDGGGETDEVGLIYGNRARWDLPSQTEQILIITRVKWDGNLHDGWGRIVSQGNGSSSDEYAIGLDNTAGQHFFVRIGNNDLPDTSHNVVAGNWYTIIAWQTGIGTNEKHLEIWDDTGLLVAIEEDGTTIAASTRNLCIGHRDLEDRTWDGWIDYCYIWHGLADPIPYLRAIFKNPNIFFLPYQQIIPVSVGAEAPSGPGTAAITLEGVTCAATGSEELTGSLAETLEGVTSSATGSQELTSSLAETLEGVTSSATGSQELTSSLAETLADVSSTASGSQELTSSLAETLADVTSAASGSEELTGSLSETLEDVTSTASGSEELTGSLAETLEGVTCVATGSSGGGTANITLEDVTSTATGAQQLTGSVSVTLEGVTSSGNATQTLTGTCAVTLADVTSAGVGALTLLASAAITLDDVTVVAVGSGGGVVTFIAGLIEVVNVGKLVEVSNVGVKIEVEHGT